MNNGLLDSVTSPLRGDFAKMNIAINRQVAKNVAVLAMVGAILISPFVFDLSWLLGMRALTSLFFGLFILLYWQNGMAGHSGFHRFVTFASGASFILHFFFPDAGALWYFAVFFAGVSATVLGIRVQRSGLLYEKRDVKTR